MEAANPIGFFDSGIGGLSIWEEVNHLLPQESTIYLADSINAPYGEKPKDKIIELSVRNTEILLRENCKLIVVACNTATTNAISILRNKYDVPFIGIEPATKPAALNSQSGKIGILATRGTLASELFLETSERYRGEVEIIQTIGTGLVPLIEAGRLEETRPLLNTFLAPMIEAGVDNIVLGCTHYPFLRPLIQTIVPEHIHIVDSGAPVARHTRTVLEEQGLLNMASSVTHRFYTNNDASTLASFAERIGANSYTAEFLDF